MESNVFEKWNNMIDAESIKLQLMEFENKEIEYDPIPFGTYDVRIENMDLKTSKKGDPMFFCQFKILEGEYKNYNLFMNQVVLVAFQIHIVNDFLRRLDTLHQVSFDGNYEHYHDLIKRILVSIDTDKLEYKLSYEQSKKGYTMFIIKEVYEPE